MVPRHSPWSPPGGMPKATEPPCQAAAPTPGPRAGNGRHEPTEQSSPVEDPKCRFNRWA